MIDAIRYTALGVVSLYGCALIFVALAPLFAVEGWEDALGYHNGRDDFAAALESELTASPAGRVAGQGNNARPAKPSFTRKRLA